ncbi:MAG: winged helix-turn-helix transcriptional regulator [Clostridia bacterium]|nr:winged helix-turn-helix transcriptional regulator [Clostridia bacterium]
MIRINTGDPHSDEILAALAEKLYFPKELELTVCSADTYETVSSGAAVILCDAEEASTVRELHGDDVHILTRPIEFSAFAEFVFSLRTVPASESKRNDAFTFDSTTGELAGPGGSVKLTPKEGELFAYLLKRMGHTVPREELRRALWRDTSATNAPDVYISYLRRKLRAVFGDGVLVNERGQGYLLKNLNSG